MLPTSPHKKINGQQKPAHRDCLIICALEILLLTYLLT